MARTPEAGLLTDRHRQLQLSLRALALRDLIRLWATVDPRNLRDTIHPFAKAGAVVVRTGHRASSATAARYYSDFRRLEGVPGQALITLEAPPAQEEFEGRLRGAGLAGVVRARAAGQTVEQAHASGLIRVAGTATGLVLGGGRNVLMGALRSDPAAKGWQRVTDGAPCSFCRMIASRGLIGKDSDVGFEAHGHCGCSAEPVFEGSRLRPDNARFREEWDQVTQGLSGKEAVVAHRRHVEGRTQPPREGAGG